MKKIVYLFLVCTMILSLCACGSKDNYLYLNEPMMVNDLEITVTDVGFSEVCRRGGSQRSADDGNVFIIIDFTVKNVGKTEKSITGGTIIKNLEYKDGFTYNVHTGWVNFKNGWHNGLETLAPLSDIAECTNCFEVPNEVIADTDFPLKATINLSDKYIFNIKSADDKSNEIFYNVGTECLNNKDYYKAYQYFYFAGNFSDAKEKRNETEVLKYLMVPYGDTESEFFNKNKDSYKLLNGDEINSIIVGDWQTSQRSDKTTKFNSDGTIENQYNGGGTWKVSENMIEIIEHKNGESNLCEMREIRDGIYLLYRDGNSPWMSLESIK